MLETGSTLQRNVNLVEADRPYSTRIASGQNSLARDGFCKENIGDAVSFMSNEMASEAHGHFFCSKLMFFR